MVLGWAEWKRKRPSLGLKETGPEQIAGKLPADQDKEELAVLQVGGTELPFRVGGRSLRRDLSENKLRLTVF